MNTAQWTVEEVLPDVAKVDGSCLNGVGRLVRISPSGSYNPDEWWAGGRSEARRQTEGEPMKALRLIFIELPRVIAALVKALFKGDWNEDSERDDWTKR